MIFGKVFSGKGYGIYRISADIIPAYKMRFPMYSYGLWKAGGREGGKSVRPRKKPLATRLSQRESGRSARRIYVIFAIVSHFLHFCQVKAPPGRKNPPVGAKSFYCLLIVGAAASSAVVAFCRRGGLPWGKRFFPSAGAGCRQTMSVTDFCPPSCRVYRSNSLSMSKSSALSKAASLETETS